MAEVLARKLSHKPKWERPTDAGDTSADAVTQDLRTEDNTLSVWRCDLTDQLSLANVVLALASNRDFLDKLDVVFLDPVTVTSAALSIAETPGDSPAHAVNSQHRDIGGITLTGLVALSRLVHSSLKDKASWRRFAKNEIREILKDAIDNGLLDKALLAKDLAAKLD